jgi:hypothetical protein
MCDENARGRTDPRPAGCPAALDPPCPTAPGDGGPASCAGHPEIVDPGGRPRPAALELPDTSCAQGRRRNEPARAGVLSHGRCGCPCRTPWAHVGAVRHQPHIGPPSRRPVTKGPGMPGLPAERDRRPRQSLGAPHPVRPRLAPAPPQDTGPSRPAADHKGHRDEGRDMPSRAHSVQGNKCNPLQRSGEMGTGGQLWNDQ